VPVAAVTGGDDASAPGPAPALVPAPAPAPEPPLTKARIWWEIAIVLALSLGASAIYAIVDIINLATQPKSIGSQSAALNPALDSRQVFDFIDQMLAIVFALAPVVLVCFLLWSAARPHLGRLGVDFTKPGRDTLWGIGLALLIGIPGILLYFVGRQLGITVNVVASPNTPYWWTIPVLILSAVRAGLQEEVIVVGYLFERLRRLGWGTWPIILSAAVLRGSYHLYQGVGSFFGNAVMGIVFGWIYVRFGRLLPLVIAHAIIDTAVFVGYPYAVAAWPALFGLK
jgi:uncharacterized protein